MTHRTPHVLTDRLAANYTKALINNPNAAVHNNIDRAVYETPLVYAAPFLLEALQEAMTLIEQFDGTSVENEKIIDMCKAAISKVGV